MIECQHCGLMHGKLCPSIRAIEYHPDGSVRRVEYLTPADHGPGLQAQLMQQRTSTPQPSGFGTVLNWPFTPSILID